MSSRTWPSGGANIDHPLLRHVEDVRRVAYVLLCSDRGLAGAYNSSVIRATEREIMAGELEGREYELITIGRKAEAYFRFRHYAIGASYTGISDKPTYEDARRIAEHITERFVSGAVDRVMLVYTEFVSLGIQRPVVRAFLPLQPTDEGGAGHGRRGHGAARRARRRRRAAFEFEPSAEAVLTDMLPRYVEARLFSALLEAAASEHASRQRAMKSATDNADDIIVRYSPPAEPGPPGRDHDRDHGDHRRRRGPQGRPQRGRRRRRSPVWLPTAGTPTSSPSTSIPPTAATPLPSTSPEEADMTLTEDPSS